MLKETHETYVYRRVWSRRWLRVPSHMGTKCKAENEQPFTEKLYISFFLKVFCNWLFVFCFAFYAYMGGHPYWSKMNRVDHQGWTWDIYIIGFSNSWGGGSKVAQKWLKSRLFQDLYKSDESHVRYKISAKEMKVTFVTKFATPSYFYFWSLVKDELLYPLFSLHCLISSLGDE